MNTHLLIPHPTLNSAPKSQNQYCSFQREPSNSVAPLNLFLTQHLGFFNIIPKAGMLCISVLCFCRVSVYDHLLEACVHNNLSCCFQTDDGGMSGIALVSALFFPFHVNGRRKGSYKINSFFFFNYFSQCLRLVSLFQRCGLKKNKK